MARKTICLNMIVKNESSVIRRCFDSVKSIIDYWVIVDTGSTDQTKQIISEFAREVPGLLLEEPWVDFSYNRNSALAFARDRGDYLLFIDADEELVFPPSYRCPDLDQDYYVVEYRHGSCRSERTLLVKSELDWKWEGVVHEAIDCPGAIGAPLHFVSLLGSRDGCRSKDFLNKNLQDAQILERAIQTDPHNTRYMFHLAGSFEAAEQYAIALKYYEKRALMSGDEREVFFSLYRIAALQQRLGMSIELFIPGYLRAFSARTFRIEPLYYLAAFFLSREWDLLAFLVSKFALSVNRINECFLTQTEIYDYGLLMQVAECSYRAGQLDETRFAIQQLLDITNLPPNIRQVIENNRFV